ncbi:immunoglobulin superfamily member 5 isoform X2 [Acanthopagrus latus]|nr:immunoglobulin superfamily member 5 isoform X2 [Acanthopagrus latus]
MTVPWKAWPDLLIICVSLCATGVVSQTFVLEPASETVLQGSNVTFSATVMGEWQIMTWSIGENQVLTITDKGDVTPYKNYSAGFCSAGDSSCVAFTIHNVSRTENGSVTCTVQGPFGSKTADLYVQEAGTISITGGNMTVQAGQQVEFQCVTFGWYPTPAVSWTRDGEAVNSSLYNTTSTTEGGYSNSTSVLTFQAVRNTTVECLATVSELPQPQSSSVFLVVVPIPPDWTVLIAVVVSIGGFALLVLLIIGIIYCYRHRKEKQSSYQDEMSRRVRTQSEISRAGQREGQVNTGYVPEGQTSVAPSEITDSGFSQANGSSVLEMPDVLNGRQAVYYDDTVDPGFKKHRHVTIV